MHKNMTMLAKVPMRPLLKRLPSEYFRSNIAITTSGVNWHEALMFAQPADSGVIARSVPI
jgi:hypothetical protein